VRGIEKGLVPFQRDLNGKKPMNFNSWAKISNFTVM
jgi:hypothetical protein